jgi:hypothetical protein
MYEEPGQVGRGDSQAKYNLKRSRSLEGDNIKLLKGLFAPV